MPENKTIITLNGHRPMFHGGVREFLVGYRSFVISPPEDRGRSSQGHRGQRTTFIVLYRR